MYRSLFLLIAAISVTSTSANTSAHAGQTKETPSGLSRFAWLAGVWKADALGGQVINTFEPAANGEIICTLQVAKEGHIVRYELCAIRSTAHGVEFSVEAFGPDLRPAPPVAERALIAASSTSAGFDGISFVRSGPNEMTVTVRVPGPDGAPQTVVIHYARTARFIESPR
jgi:Domain of unknown function (DUF6265)